jgi:filamentous hemagglutinin
LVNGLSNDVPLTGSQYSQIGAVGDVSKIGNGTFEGTTEATEKGLVYEKAPYHGTTGNSIKSKAPKNGQATLNTSVEIKATTSRRVGVDPSTGEYVVFDETQEGVFHGHVRSWNELTSQMQNALRNAGFVNKNGKILMGK